MAKTYENVNTRIIKLNTHKAEMVQASEHTENLTDFSYLTGYISIRHADLYNMMKELEGNAFKLYLYLYCQQEGTQWALHRERVMTDLGLSAREYRTAIAKLIESGYLDIETATLEGIKPLTTEELLVNLVPEIYKDNLSKDYRQEEERHPSEDQLLSYTRYLSRSKPNAEKWYLAAKEMAQPTEDRTYNTKREAIKARDELLGQEKGSI